MYAGLFKSKIEDDYLIPEFDSIYFVKGDKVQKENFNEVIVGRKSSLNTNPGFISI